MSQNNHNLKNKNKFKKTLIKAFSIGVLASSVVVPNVNAAVIYSSDPVSYNYYNIEEQTRQYQDKIFSASYEQEMIRHINDAEKDRAEEIRVNKELEEQKTKLEQEVVQQKFEEKMKKLQEENERKRIDAAAPYTSLDGNHDSEAAALGYRTKSVGTTTVQQDMDMIVSIIKENVNTYSEDQKTIARSLPEYLGKSYVWGANGPSSYDCSGFTKSILAKVNKYPPRTAADQFLANPNKVDIPDLQLGDLVFFKNTGSRRGITHVGLYIGNGLMVHASSSYNSVKIESVFGGYFSGKYVGAVRY